MEFGVLRLKASTIGRRHFNAAAIAALMGASSPGTSSKIGFAKLNACLYQPPGSLVRQRDIPWLG
ncbi:MAG TPA: hypothetical protein VN043_15200 [Rhodanobacter sp.]|nr:hypothetical protein [Rhodanobacter sp.]